MVDDKFVAAGEAIKAIDVHNKMDDVYSHDQNAGITVILSHDTELLPGRG